MNPSQAVLLTTAHPNDWVALRVVMDTCFILVDGAISHPVANRLTDNSLAEYAEKVPAADLSDFVRREAGLTSRPQPRSKKPG